MRSIIKSSEPRSLTEHRLGRFTSYDNYSDKDTLRRFLLEEQGGLCCYCCGRIDANNMKIEHWHCQDKHPQESLDYRNLLGTCSGGEGRPPEQQHCDTYKANQDLSVNPANPTHNVHGRLRYLVDGTITATDSVLEVEINGEGSSPEATAHPQVRGVLNLNTASLKNSRRGELKAFTDLLTKRGKLTTPTLERLVKQWEGGPARGQLEPFSPVVVYWLRKKLARCSA